MTRPGVVAIVALAVQAALAVASEPGVADRHPVYVGVRVCTQCHAGKEAGHQFSLWRASKHAEAYACLWSPAAKKIAKLSGIRQEPHEAGACLGCHATAFDTEGWEREPTFFLEDGVQCEACHGPGSEYMTAEVMRDRQKAMMNGLRMPGERDCMMCHNVKGSHVAYLDSKPFDVQTALRCTAHPIPAGADVSAAAAKPAPVNPDRSDSASRHKYAGVMACAACHRGPRMGYQFSKWRMSKHARAYAVLGTPAAYQMASSQPLLNCSSSARSRGSRSRFTGRNAISRKWPCVMK